MFIAEERRDTADKIELGNYIIYESRPMKTVAKQMVDILVAVADVTEQSLSDTLAMLENESIKLQNYVTAIQKLKQEKKS